MSTEQLYDRLLKLDFEVAAHKPDIKRIQIDSPRTTLLNKPTLISTTIQPKTKEISLQFSLQLPPRMRTTLQFNSFNSTQFVPSDPLP